MNIKLEPLTDAHHVKHYLEIRAKTDLTFIRLIIFLIQISTEKKKALTTNTRPLVITQHTSNLPEFRLVVW